MVDLRPARAWHPNPSRASPDALVCPVYDTLSEVEQERYASASPFNAAGFVPRPRSVELASFLERARIQLQRAKESEAYVQDPRPSYYVYGIRYVPPADILEALDPSQRRPEYLLLGLVGAIDLDRLGHGEVALHERTFPDRVLERVALTDATGMTFAPILAGYHDPEHRLNGRLERALGLDRRGLAFEGNVAPVAEARLGPTLHRLWRIEAPDQVAALRAEVAPLRLLILDGHHRFAAAARRTYEGRPTAPLVMIVDSADRALQLLPWHRIVPAEVVPYPRLVEAAGTHFREVRGAAEATEVTGALDRLRALRRRDDRGFLMVSGGRAVEVVGTPSRDAGADFDQLHAFLDETLEVARDRIRFVRSPREALDAVRAAPPAASDTAVLLPPLDARGVEARAFERGEVMAEKSTMFLPKVAEGILFAPADGGTPP